MGKGFQGYIYLLEQEQDSTEAVTENAGAIPETASFTSTSAVTTIADTTAYETTQVVTTAETKVSENDNESFSDNPEADGSFFGYASIFLVLIIGTASVVILLYSLRK